MDDITVSSQIKST